MKSLLVLPALILIGIHYAPLSEYLVFDSTNPSFITALLSQLIHWNTNHLYGNALMLTVLLVLYFDYVGLKFLLTFSTIIILTISMYLLVGYDYTYYKGFSGILYGLSVGLPLYTLCKGQDVITSMIILLGSLTMILPISSLQAIHLDIGTHIAYDIHVVGASTGLLISSWYVLMGKDIRKHSE